MPTASTERQYSQLDGYEVFSYFSCDDELFVAEIDALPGCATDGATRDEALQALVAAKAEWVEVMSAMGKQIPVPQHSSERIMA